jgi:hypothetical protein
MPRRLPSESLSQAERIGPVSAMLLTVFQAGEVVLLEGNSPGLQIPDLGFDIIHSKTNLRV